MIEFLEFLIDIFYPFSSSFSHQVVDDIRNSSLFMCYLNNTMGSITKMFEIDVQSSPQFVDSDTEKKVSVKLHHGQIFDCKVTGNPKPTVKWIFVSFMLIFYGTMTRISRMISER